MSHMGRPITNRYKVPAKIWTGWSNTERRVFNKTFEAMRPSCQLLFTHPEAMPIPRKHWATLRWNAAFTAAEVART